jgi:15-cis-phytoene desaturase
MAKRVVVLGGGVGGMSAAHELSERGFDVEVHEAKNVPGGKARSIYVAGSGSDGRRDLPGEHGFRFFPGFYRHLPDTMKRIPFPGRRQGVYDNLVQAREYLIAAGAQKSYRFLVRFPRSLREWRELLAGIYQGSELGIGDDELAFFIGRVLILLTSCQERRLAEYEQIDWWRFIEADGKSDAYQLYLAVGLTRSLVALKAKEASTRTVGDILIQLLLGIYSPFHEFDRLLDGPTSEVWLEPWHAHLLSRGVVYERQSQVVGLAVGDDGAIAGATVQRPDGTRRQVRGDYYVLALPVEAVLPLVDARLRAAEPRLGQLGELQVAWMNGLQLFLRRDARLVGGHANYVSTPNALTSISQEQFFRRKLTDYGDGSVRGCLSIDISDWDTPGVVYGKPLVDLDSAEEVMTEARTQLRAALSPELARTLDDDNLVRWFLDPDIVFPNPSAATNLEPLLINTRDSWKNRPDAVTRIPNLFLAADYVRTYTDLATMEGANEAARRAVNGILAASGTPASPCRLWPLHEPTIFAPARLFDLIRFKLGLPHLGLGRAATRDLKQRPAAAHPLRRTHPAHEAAVARPSRRSL